MLAQCLRQFLPRHNLSLTAAAAARAFAAAPTASAAAAAAAGPAAGGTGAQQKLWLGNLPFAATKENIEDLFRERFGPVHEVFMLLNRDGRPRGMAFITLDTAQAQQVRGTALLHLPPGRSNALCVLLLVAPIALTCAFVGVRCRAFVGVRCRPPSARGGGQDGMHLAMACCLCASSRMQKMLLPCWRVHAMCACHVRMHGCVARPCIHAPVRPGASRCAQRGVPAGLATAATVRLGR